MRALVASNPDFEFVFVSAPYNGLWIRDPPGGKGRATTDPDWAAASIAVLDDAVATQGPFAGILGYSQGSAFVPIYLAHAPAGTFQFALMFCGYLTTTHTGLLNRVRAASPFGGIPALVWMGSQDYIISNAMTRGQAAKFTSPSIVSSQRGGHSVPTTSDETYSQVLAFLSNQLQGGGNNEGGSDDKNDSSEDGGTKEDDDTEKCNPNTFKGLVCKSGKKARSGDWGACGRGRKKFTGRLYCPQGFAMCSDGKCQTSAKLCGKAGVKYNKKACDSTGKGKDDEEGNKDGEKGGDQNKNDQKDADKEGGKDDKDGGSKDDGTKEDDTEKCNPNTFKGLVCKSGKKARSGDWGACGRGRKKFTGRLYCPQGFAMCSDGKCQTSAKLCGKAGVKYNKKACDTAENGKDEEKAGNDDDDKDGGSYWDDYDDKKWGF